MKFSSAHFPRLWYQWVHTSLPTPRNYGNSLTRSSWSSDHASSALDSLCHTYKQKREIDYPNVAQSHINDIALDILPPQLQLRCAYIEARYDQSYTITKDELEWLEERVRVLKSITEEVCRQRIEQFRLDAVG